MNDQTIKLDISKKPVMIAPLILRQGDKNGTTLHAQIYENGEPFDVSEYGARLCLDIPGSMYYEVDGSTWGNTAEFSIDETYCTNYGETSNSYVQILDGESVICSTNSFRLRVLENAETDADPSTAYTNGVRAAIQECDDAASRAIAAAEAAEGVVLQDVPLMSETVRGGAQVGGSVQVNSGLLNIKLTDSATGESVTTESSSYLRRLEKYGMATQNGTPTPDNPIPIEVVEGANLLNLGNRSSTSRSAAVETITDANTMDVAPTSTAAKWAHVDMTWNDALVTGRSYVLACKYSGNTHNMKFGIGVRKSDNSGYIASPANNAQTAANGTFIIPFTADGSNLIIYWYMNYSGTDAGTTDPIHITEIMLNAGSAALPYVPYGSLGLQVNIPTESSVYKTGYSINASGVESALELFNILSASAVGRECGILTYTKTTTVAQNTRVHAYDSNGNWIAQAAVKNTAEQGTYTVPFTLPPNTEEVRISMAIADTLDSLKLGNVAVQIDLQGNVLASLPDGTKDTLNVDSTGHVTIYKIVDSVDLGSLAWQYNSNFGGYGAFYSTSMLFKYVSDAATPNMLCTSYTVVSRNVLYSSSAYGFTLTGSVQQRYATVRNTDYSDPTVFGNAMSGVYAYYELMTPQTIDLGYITIPELPSGATVEVLSSRSSSMSADWWTEQAAPIAESLAEMRDLIVTPESTDAPQESVQSDDTRSIDEMRGDEPADELRDEGVDDGESNPVSECDR